MNTILTDKYREEYKPVIQELFEHCPEMMSRKLELANVQQAHTFDMTRKLSTKDSKILCVGSFEDTACESLQALGYYVTGIDPAVNVGLNDFFEHNQQSISPRKFDVIFSTSVIEHVPNDEEFIDQICKLLSPGGYGVLTCDFRDDYKEGDPKPGEDFRLFTKHDLLVRLNEVLVANNCSLVGEPDYDYPPDFWYGNYNYSFATYTFRKNG